MICRWDADYNWQVRRFQRRPGGGRIQFCISFQKCSSLWIILYSYLYLYFISECSSVNHNLYLPIYRCRLINLLKVLKQRQYFSPNDHRSNATINLTIRVLQNFPCCKGKIYCICFLVIELKEFHWKLNWPKVAEAQKCVAALDVDKDGDFSNTNKILNLNYSQKKSRYMLPCTKLSILLV